MRPARTAAESRVHAGHAGRTGDVPTRGAAVGVAAVPAEEGSLRAADSISLADLARRTAGVPATTGPGRAAASAAARAITAARSAAGQTVRQAAAPPLIGLATVAPTAPTKAAPIALRVPPAGRGAIGDRLGQFVEALAHEAPFRPSATCGYTPRNPGISWGPPERSGTSSGTRGAGVVGAPGELRQSTQIVQRAATMRGRELSERSS